MKKVLFTFVAFLATSLASFAQTDTIWLKNGKEIVGEILFLDSANQTLFVSEEKGEGVVLKREFKFDSIANVSNNWAAFFKKHRVDGETVSQTSDQRSDESTAVVQLPFDNRNVENEIYAQLLIDQRTLVEINNGMESFRRQMMTGRWMAIGFGAFGGMGVGIMQISRTTAGVYVGAAFTILGGIGGIVSAIIALDSYKHLRRQKLEYTGNGFRYKF